MERRTSALIFASALIILGVAMMFFEKTEKLAWFPLSFGIGFGASII